MSQFQDLPEVVKVTLLLSGGQQYQVAIQSGNPLLGQLFEVMADWEGKRVRRLFQIPINQGQAVLAFPCDRLIGIVTEPPIVMQTQSNPPIAAAPNQPVTPSGILPSESVQIDDFLSPEDHQMLLNYVLEREEKFVPTTTSTGLADYRQSIVLYDFPEVHEFITNRIRAIVPDVVKALGLPPFTLQEIEAQITAHNDGNFYRVHNDNGSPETATRELTYVYYFYRQPKAFSGGELVIYDSKIENNYFVQADTFQTIDPRDNSIVLFLSRYMHEVMPVHCPSRSFEDSRFTVNGWIRR
ncbi:2OG-Fe(II) oxygenase [Leptolyngbya ohadii]|uniref:2OG-Fe(II) oxygenase n=1 Tax=Leptolyngbya ohadii TaxID=1962290 RepID=UPI000B59CEFC|nr:2OG-Fe(II) oxygenase [Leptolyngbya ohadii]